MENYGSIAALRGRMPRLLAFLPIATLCAIAALQIYRVHAEDLTPWKGGGFGMFATTESHATRFVRAYLLRTGASGPIELRVEPPRRIVELQRAVEEMRAIPTADRIREVARTLAMLDWRVWVSKARGNGLPPVVTDPDRGPSDDDSGGVQDLDRSSGPLASIQDDLSPWHTGPTAMPRITVVGEPGTENAESEKLNYHGVRVEIWRTVFDARTSSVRAVLIRNHTARASYAGPTKRGS